MAGIASRPEAWWALAAGILGALATAAVMVKAILGSASSTAAIGFIFVPVLAAVATIPFAVWGLALGHVVARLRGKVAEPWIVFWVALAAALAFPAAAALEAWRGLALERAVAEVPAMDARRLEEEFERSPWNRDKFFLGALALNPAATPRLLDRIARLDDPDLYEPLGSLWDVKGANRKGIAVMRLVAHHANAAPETLARFDASPQAEKVIHEVLANPATPAAVIARHANDTNYLAEWGLALNPKAPREVLERLSRSENRYTRMNLTYNKGTPRDILERLARDPDELLARNAALALERRP